jgi:large subunit ribosomal protein LP1
MALDNALMISTIQASAELAATYGSLILADDGIDITVRKFLLLSWPAHLIVDSQSEKILAITDAAGVDLDPIWASLLAKALEGKNVKELLSNVGSGGGAPAVGAPAAAGSGSAAAGAPAEEKKEEEKEESDEDMVRTPLSMLVKCLHLVLDRALVSLTDGEPHRIVLFIHLHCLLATPL